MRKFLSSSAEETKQFAKAFAKNLPINSIVCLFGNLAAGKTTFVKGIVEGVTSLQSSEVQSPTFTYLNIYEGNISVFHFDLYRLKDIYEFLSMGFDDYFEAGGICCIEWSEIIAPYLPSTCIHIELSHAEEQNERIITIK